MYLNEWTVRGVEVLIRFLTKGRRGMDGEIGDVCETTPHRRCPESWAVASTSSWVSGMRRRRCQQLLLKDWMAPYCSWVWAALPASHLTRSCNPPPYHRLPESMETPLSEQKQTYRHDVLLHTNTINQSMQRKYMIHQYISPLSINTSTHGPSIHQYMIINTSIHDLQNINTWSVNTSIHDSSIHQHTT